MCGSPYQKLNFIKKLPKPYRKQQKKPDRNIKITKIKPKNIQNKISKKKQIMKSGRKKKFKKKTLLMTFLRTSWYLDSYKRWLSMFIVLSIRLLIIVLYVH